MQRFNLRLIFTRCAYCSKKLAEDDECINGGVIYPEVWCSEEHKELWLINRVSPFL